MGGSRVHEGVKGLKGCEAVGFNGGGTMDVLDCGDQVEEVGLQGWGGGSLDSHTTPS